VLAAVRTFKIDGICGAGLHLVWFTWTKSLSITELSWRGFVNAITETRRDYTARKTVSTVTTDHSFRSPEDIEGGCEGRGAENKTRAHHDNFTFDIQNGRRRILQG